MSGEVKGWCPGALRPMASGDGLVVRLRLSCGEAPLAALRAIAEAAQTCGNGALDLSARAHLQIRGVSEATLPALYERLGPWLDASPEAEAVRNVLVSPFAGLEPGVLDVRPLARAWERELASDPKLWKLPGKFGFAFDAGARPLGAAHADVTFEALAPDALVARLADGPALGPFAPTEATRIARALARAFLALSPAPKRMRDALAAHGLEPFVGATGLEAAAEPCELTPHSNPLPPKGVADARLSTGFGDREPQAYLGVQALPSPRPSSPACGGGPEATAEGEGAASVPRAFAGFAAPFGRLAAADLAALAEALAQAGGEGLRLTPWRALIAPLPTLAAAQRTVETAARLGFLTDPADPLLAVAACPGAPECSSALGDTRRLARDLAAKLRTNPAQGVALHVSGCAKGCAHPAPAPVTLVATAQGYDLVRAGRAGDRPSASLAAARVLEGLP